MTSRLWSIGCIVALCCSCSGGSDADRSASNPPLQGGTTLDDVVESVTGYTMGELSSARLDAQGKLGMDCMRERGFDPDPKEFPTSAPDGTEPPKAYGGTTENALNTVRDYQPVVTTPDSADYDVAYDICLPIGIDGVVDPLVDFRAWLEQASKDLTDRIFADQRLVAADMAERRCLEDLGYGYSTVNEFVNSIVDRANPIVESFIAGSTTQAEAQSLLLALRAEEDELSPRVNACADKYQTVLVQVRSEYFDDFAARYQVQITEQLRTADLSDVSSFLPPK